ncbi:MAG: hypothetical protein KKA79_03780 [Nanoarchaeota archaeon]|nr:hypothetical protein [Nanoarchaeota archaeon]
MFLRSKRIKKHDYYYIVKNTRTRDGVRQKVIEYKGRLAPVEVEELQQRLKTLRKTRNKPKRRRG